MSRVKHILKKYGIGPLRRLGQNFLTDCRAVQKTILAAELHKTDVVLEIGPGTGVLTKELAKRVRKVVAVEKDKRMINVLKETLKGFNNIEVIRGDILKIPNDQLSITNYKVVANLPFYLTAPLIRKLLECNEARPRYMVLVVQKEVAQRICAKPPRMNLLAVSVQFYAEPKIISYISKSSFWPQPRVDSAIIKIIPSFRYTNKYTPDELLVRRFFKVVRAGFSQPRKQLVNNLSKKLQLDKHRTSLWLLENGIRPEQRAENLTIEDWVNLAKTFDDK